MSILKDSNLLKEGALKDINLGYKQVLGWLLFWILASAGYLPRAH